MGRGAVVAAGLLPCCQPGCTARGQRNLCHGCPQLAQEHKFPLTWQEFGPCAFIHHSFLSNTCWARTAPGEGLTSHAEDRHLATSPRFP